MWTRFQDFAGDRRGDVVLVVLLVSLGVLMLLQ